MDVRRFQNLPPVTKSSWVDDARSGADRLLAVGGWVKRGIHKSARGVVLRRDVGTYVDMPFIRCSKEEIYLRRLALIL